MRNTIIKLFNLEPQDIKQLHICSEDYTVLVFITLRKQFQRCPKCGCSTKLVHDYRKRTLEHGIINDAFTTIVYNQRRYFCSECGHSFPEANPFAQPGKRLSKYLIIRIMKMLKNPRTTYSQVADAIGVSTSTVMRVFDSHAGVTPISIPACLCIDEIYAVKRKQQVYACVLVDMITSQIYDILPNRFKSDISDYFSTINLSERSKVKYVCMDMYDVYRDLSQLYFPNAKICVDSFHVIQLVNRAFTSIRIKVMNRYGRDTDEYKLLKKFQWMLTKNSSRIDLDKTIELHRYSTLLGTRYPSPRRIINCLLDLDMELCLAYELKEEYFFINSTVSSTDAAERFDHFLSEIAIYDIEEFNSLLKTLKKWRNEIINSFDNYEGKRISNGPIESVNSRLKLIKRNGNGYRDFERFKKRALYSLNNDSSITI